MKEIRHLFSELSEKYPALSSWTVFTRLLKTKKIPRNLLVKSFGILVERGDYLQSERKALLNYLTSKSA